MPNLFSFNLTRCGINDEGLKVLSGINLHKINLSGDPVTAKGITYLFSCPRLKVLKLENCSKITPFDVQKLQKSKPNWRIQTADLQKYDLKDALDIL